jgi:hypothetical protein
MLWWWLHLFSEVSTLRNEVANVPHVQLSSTASNGHLQNRNQISNYQRQKVAALMSFWLESYRVTTQRPLYAKLEALEVHQVSATVKAHYAPERQVVGLLGDNRPIRTAWCNHRTHYHSLQEVVQGLWNAEEALTSLLHAFSG